MSKLMRRHEIGFSSDDPLPIMVSRRTQARIQVKRVAVFEIFWKTKTIFATVVLDNQRRTCTFIFIYHNQVRIQVVCVAVFEIF